ncbi:UDP-N-acetylglucosamine 2-epimerase (non-hydrolyzing) [Allosphingosinicella flava]|uniref:UDP-N-acetylglucosamine 2-epimerase (non-hydrolyzing) n=1 Tax=Allosphingosinicella flava TaxID=2771430 RepID=A0A7T2LMA0_9SPHN|nr:UDP-N-acetylglucosamine 2-epimerase (non-hydrolyzing) [Sphingosinicella flava]QPQ55316.1 UDP-N-acetylglucosamine 2-epimerase (non-hydrolyzing) [Sphingosinicella flava]
MRQFVVASVIGTRPEAIKMLPLIRALASIPAIAQKIVFTGQQPGLASMMKLDTETIHLPHVPGKAPVGQSRWRLRAMIAAQIKRSGPDLLLVHGDTTSAVAGALAAWDRGVPIGHVEAGLRSFDPRAPWPEEGNRIVIDRMADLLFAPTSDAADNLLDDHLVKGRIFITGNTGIDALFAARDSTRKPPPSAERTLVVTCHRKENQGRRTRDICTALIAIADRLPVSIAFPLHANPAVRRPIEQMLGGHPRIRLLEPLTYREMVRLMTQSWAILTDSGGLQEEGTALGRPVLVLRDVTERGEAIASDNIRLVGTDPDRIFAEVGALCANPTRYRAMSMPSLTFGDGRAAPRIASIIAEWLARCENSRALPLPAQPISANDLDHDDAMVSRQLEAV